MNTLNGNFFNIFFENSEKFLLDEIKIHKEENEELHNKIKTIGNLADQSMSHAEQCEIQLKSFEVTFTIVTRKC